MTAPPSRSGRSWRWTVQRLRAMSLGEVVWRVQLERTKARWRSRGLPAPERTLWEALRTLPFGGLPLPPGALAAEVGAGTRQAVVQEAEEIMRGQWRFFAFAEAPTPPSADGLTDWHRCEYTQRRADPGAFGPTLDYRDVNLVGDVKTTWEKSRHHHTTLLAVAYALTGDGRYAAGAVERINDWIEANPPLRGVNWASGLEVGLRLMAWAWVYELLRPHPRWAEWFGHGSPLWTSVYQQQSFLEHFESRGSSANNHLLGELAGQYVASLTWPVFPESARWQRAAKAALTQQGALQFFDSGVNREMGFGYHLASTELLLLPALLGQGRGDPFDPAYLARLARAIRVIDELRAPDGALPRYGDDDEGLSVQLESRAEPLARVDGLLRVGRDWLGVPVREPASGHLSAALLLGVGRPRSRVVAPPAQGSLAYPDAGLYLLRSGQGEGELRVLADAGPLGYLSLAGHGHADALAFTLDAGGQPVVVDPGVYLYHTDPLWRSAFRATAAHNTLEVAGQDQSVQEGAFLWSHKALATAHRWEPRAQGAFLDASHNGYLRLGGRPLHRRQFHLDGRVLTLTDTLTGQGPQGTRLHLHLHPHCAVEAESGGSWLVTWPGGALRARFDPVLSVRCGRGEEPTGSEPPLGWYSPRYGLKVPSPSFRASGSFTLPVTLTTTLELL